MVEGRIVGSCDGDSVEGAEVGSMVGWIVVGEILGVAQGTAV